MTQTLNPSQTLVSSVSATGTQVKTAISSIDTLTGLRMIAAGVVYLAHLHVWRSYPDGFPIWLQTIMKHGYVGVLLFFTLSGFVICYTYFDRLETRFSSTWKSYFVARFARIYPMYFLAFALGVATAAVSNQKKPSLPVTLEWLTATQTWDRKIQVFDTYLTDFPGWSVGVEIFLYIAFPFLVFPILQRCKSIRSLVVLLGLANLIAFAVPTLFLITGFASLSNGQSWSDPTYYLYYFPPTHLCAFVSGAAAARLYVRLKMYPVSKRENLLGSIALFVAIGGCIFLMMQNWNIWVFYSFNAALLPFFTVTIFCLARYRNPIAWILSRRWAVLLGEASYSFYLLHFYVIYLNGDFLGKDSSSGKNFVYGLIIFCLLLLTSLGCYTYYEMPMRKLIRRIALLRSSQETA
ncbi:MAG TPA: acyltransferase [Chloroflexia bacterium]|nr:acyltransferase [Chloroflexia bacterium]